MPGDPKECRQRSARCLELAAATVNEGLKKMLLGLAKHWEMLAEEIERTKKFLEDERGALRIGVRNRRRKKSTAAKRKHKKKKPVPASRRVNGETGWSLW